MSEQFHLFYGGVFSQWQRCEFHVASVKYNCAEQYMMAEKARLFKDEKVRQAIMKASHPRDQKALGRTVANFEEKAWNAVARDIVYRGNYAKFTQNEGYKKILLETAPLTLVEASYKDKIWGIGRGESDPNCLIRENWLGTNWLGEVLTKVRDDLIAGVVTTENFQWA